MKARHVVTALGWSVATAVLAALDMWVVTVLALSWDVPVEAAALLAVVVMGLTCLLGCRFAAGRLRSSGPATVAALVFFPAVMAVVNAALSTGPMWFRLVTVVLVLGGALAGALGSRDDAPRPVTDRRFSATR